MIIPWEILWAKYVLWNMACYSLSTLFCSKLQIPESSGINHTTCLIKGSRWYRVMWCCESGLLLIAVSSSDVNAKAKCSLKEKKIEVMFEKAFFLSALSLSLNEIIAWRRGRKWWRLQWVEGSRTWSILFYTVCLCLYVWVCTRAGLMWLQYHVYRTV